ncbi:MAG: hypothetical protein QOI42_369 [Frankiaceae bacterium]|jgi:hypothetical protein|nr:hypothetical protein [Frankiaceae bacterium]
MTLFGEAAELYVDARPGFPVTIADAIAAYAGPVAALVEIGAGTGKGTAVFHRLADHIVCLEPDPLMAAELRRLFPDVEVRATDFESWQPPPGGVPLLVGSLVWHWLDAATRCARAHAALTPGGVLGIVGRSYAFADDDQRRIVEAAIVATGWEGGGGPHDRWIAEDIAASDLFDDVTVSRHDTSLALPTEDYLRLASTWSPFLRLPTDGRERATVLLRDAVTACGGVVDLLLATTLTLARRRATAPRGLV